MSWLQDEHNDFKLFDKLAFFFFSLFFGQLLITVLSHASIFVGRYGQTHRMIGACYLFWLLLGYIDLFGLVTLFDRNQPAQRAIYEILLPTLGLGLTLSAAFDFKEQHSQVRNVASGSLHKHATITYKEMLEHAFYQGLNIVQCLYLHVLGHTFSSSSSSSSSSSPVSNTDTAPATQLASFSLFSRLVLLFLVTLPWYFRKFFPVNSFSANYTATGNPNNSNNPNNPVNSLSANYISTYTPELSSKTHNILCLSESCNTFSQRSSHLSCCVCVCMYVLFYMCII